ncbi:MAG: CopG family antitoxin [Burkholderiales bacterium]|nr:CopG family antitoxin [Burkholderiales bacterium]
MTAPPLSTGRSRPRGRRARSRARHSAGTYGRARAPAASVASLPNLEPTTQSISLRLPLHLLDRIKSAANARDVPYQSLIKVWLEEKAKTSA